MEMVVKVGIVVLLTAILSAGLRKTVPDIAIVLQLAGVLAAVLIGTRVLQPILSFASESAAVFGASGVYVKPVMQVSAIGAVSTIGCSLCKDAGQASAEAVLELFASAAAVYTALPVLQLFVHTIGELL